MERLLFPGYTRSPDFPPGLDWLNVNTALSMSELLGKVVILDFWTFG